MTDQTRESPLAKATRGLTLAMAGDSLGLDLYAEAVRDVRHGAVPVFMHLSMLRQHRLDPLAAELERRAVQCGADISASRVWPQNPEKTVAEYGALFARGLINTTMINAYAEALSHAGRAGELSALFAPDSLLCVSRVEDAAPDGRPLHQAALDALLELRSQADFVEVRQSVHLMDRLVLSPSTDVPILRTMFAVLRARAEQYVAALRGTDHLLAAHLPATFGMTPWVLYSDGRGYNTAHIHPRGWVTGILYLACDPPADADGAGALHIEPPLGGNADCPGWLRATIRPEPGLFVLMPSFYSHRVQALGRPGLRIVLPFDLRNEAL